MSNTPLIYSPLENIPIGEPILLESNTHAIRFKYKRKNGKIVHEIIPVDTLHELVIKNALKSRNPKNEESAKK